MRFLPSIGVAVAGWKRDVSPDEGENRYPTDMRIVTDAAYLLPVGGVESSTFEDATALARRGHAVDILFGVDGIQREDYGRAGIAVHGPFEFKIDRRHLIRTLRRFWSAARTVRRLNPDVLWLNRIEHVLWAQMVCRVAGVPIVAHIHHAPSFGQVPLRTWGVSRFVAVSDFTRNQWIARGLPATRTTVVNNAVPADRYTRGGLRERDAARAALDLPGDAPLALFYGHISEAKGVADLLRAWRLLGREDAVLVVAGWPRPADDPVLAAELELLPLGAVRWMEARTNVIPLLHATDIVVAPSLLPESFGRVVIEALATARPVIASRIGAIPEILSESMSRFLVTPGDPSDLAQCIGRYLDWRSVNPSLGEECAEWVTQRFPFDSHLGAIEDLLQQHSRTQTHRHTTQGRVGKTRRARR